MAAINVGLRRIMNNIRFDNTSIVYAITNGILPLNQWHCGKYTDMPVTLLLTWFKFNTNMDK